MTVHDKKRMQENPEELPGIIRSDMSRASNSVIAALCFVNSDTKRIVLYTFADVFRALFPGEKALAATARRLLYVSERVA